MKRFVFLAVFLAACQPVEKDTEVTVDTKVETKVETIEVAHVVQADVVALRLKPPVSEPRACIIPIRVENGLEASTNVVMIGFDLSGPGEPAKGNMFAPTAQPGEASEARVIVQGQSCDAFDTIKIPQIRCTSGEQSCEDKIKLIDGKSLRFSQTG